MAVWLVLLSGCATTGPKEDVLVYPPPPDEPKVAYIRSYYGEGDFRKSGFLDFLLGYSRDTMLARPYGVFASADKIYVTTTTSPALVVIDEKEQAVQYLGTRGSARVVLPLGIAGAPDGTIFVADGTKNRVFGYDSEGKLRVAIGKKDEFKKPSGLAVNGKLGRLYVTDSFGHEVHVYSMDGEALFNFGKKGYGDGEFLYPTNVTIDQRNGDVFVVDTQNARVQVFDQDGKYKWKFGELGDVPGTFTRPKGIGIDSEGNIYVVDTAFNNIQVFEQNTGRVLGYIGAAGNVPGRFQLPAGLYVDENDRIYVVDSMNGRIQVFQYLSERWKKENPEQYKKYLLTEAPKKDSP